jgi:hypothetical protein
MMLFAPRYISYMLSLSWSGHCELSHSVSAARIDLYHSAILQRRMPLTAAVQS